MRCRSCGAEIRDGKYCEYCGAAITPDMRKEREEVKKQGCPSCFSSNIQFERENHGKIEKDGYVKVIYKTVGFCKDCGFTWYPQVKTDDAEIFQASLEKREDSEHAQYSKGTANDIETIRNSQENGNTPDNPKIMRGRFSNAIINLDDPSESKNNTKEKLSEAEVQYALEPVHRANKTFWILGWIFMFPVPLTALIWRKKNTWSATTKVFVTILLWFMVLMFWNGKLNNGQSDNVQEQTTNQSVQADQGKNQPVSHQAWVENQFDETDGSHKHFINMVKKRLYHDDTFVHQATSYTEIQDDQVLQNVNQELANLNISVRASKGDLILVMHFSYVNKKGENAEGVATGVAIEKSNQIALISIE